jgi:hypothetical protein
MKQKTHLLAQVEISDGTGGSHSAPPFPAHLDRLALAAADEVDRELLLPGQDVEVDQVAERRPVDAQEPVARLEARLRRQPARLDTQHSHPNLRDPLGHDS